MFLKNKNFYFILFLVIITILGLWLRIYQIDQVLFSPAELNYQDQLWSSQVSWSQQIFGISEWSTRLPALIWGMLLPWLIFFLSWQFFKNCLLSGILYYTAIFSPDFIELSRHNSSLVMYLALFFLLCSLIFVFRSKTARATLYLGTAAVFICGVLLSGFSLESWTTLANNFSRLAWEIFADFRFLWLGSIFLFYFLFTQSWLKQKQLRVLVNLAIILFILTAGVSAQYNQTNFLFIVLSVFVWLFLFYSLADYFKNKIVFFGLALLLTVAPAVPALARLPLITAEFQIDNALTKDKQTALFQYLMANRLSMAHLISPLEYYLQDYNFSYQNHPSVSDYQAASIIRYLEKNETGYLIYPQNKEQKINYNLRQRIKETLQYHSAISQQTGYQVYSWDVAQAKKFIDYEI